MASLSQGRTAAAQCGLFTHKSVPVIFEPPCILASMRSWGNVEAGLSWTFRSAVGPTQPRIQWTLEGSFGGESSQGVTLVTGLLLVLR